MSLPLYFSILTLTPALVALVLCALGFTRRLTSALAIGLSALGAIIPLICLAILGPDISGTTPLELQLAGPSPASVPWLAPVYRLDPLGVAVAIGVSVIVVPLLLWLAWRGAPTGIVTASNDSETSAESEDADEVQASEDDATAPTTDEMSPSLTRPARWGGMALVLGLESAALMLCFADNIVWLGLVWVVVALLAWGLGELGNDTSILDRPGLVASLLGPVAWVVAMMLVAAPAHAFRLLDLTGTNNATAGNVVLIAVVLALAAGAYPFITWVLRRSAFAMPAGFGALLLVLMPATLFIGLRTFSALSTDVGLWPTIGTTTPPVTAGVAFVVLGVLTLGVTGLLALTRRDARTLLTLLAVAQIGWGFLGLGIGQPGSITAVIVLLAVMVLALGALLASSVYGGTIAADVETDGAGPRAFGAHMRPLVVAAWLIGALSLLGAPLFAGFVPQQMISESALAGMRIGIPLVGLAWVGDILLALAIVRALAPAFARNAADEAADAAQSDSIEEHITTVSESDETADDSAVFDAETLATGGVTFDWHQAPAVLLAALAVVIGVAPQALLTHGAVDAAASVLPPNALVGVLQTSSGGYTINAAQWYPTLAWCVVLVGAAVMLLVRALVRRPQTAIVVAGEDVETESIESAEAVTAQAEPADAPAAVPAIPVEPVTAWSDLVPAARSEVLLPGSTWLLAGTDDTDGASDASEAGAENAPGDSHEHDSVDETPSDGSDTVPTRSSTRGKAR